MAKNNEWVDITALWASSEKKPNEEIKRPIRFIKTSKDFQEIKDAFAEIEKRTVFDAEEGESGIMVIMKPTGSSSTRAPVWQLSARIQRLKPDYEDTSEEMELIEPPKDEEKVPW